MFNDRYRLLSSVAHFPEGDAAGAGDLAGVAPAASQAPAGDPSPAAKEGDGAKPNGAAAAADGDKKDGEAKPPRSRSGEAVFQDRIGELTRHRREAERQAASERERADKAEADLRAAQALLEARGKPNGEGDTKPAPMRSDVPAATPAEVLSTPEGRRAVREQARIEARADEISRRGDEIYDGAVKEFGQAKVDKAMANFKAFDGLRVELAEAIFELDDDAHKVAHKVLFDIGSDPDTIDRLYKIADTNPVRLGVEVAKIATKAAAKPSARKVSEAPEPPDIINPRGNTEAVDLADKNLPMAKWVEEREKDLKKRGVRL